MRMTHLLAFAAPLALLLPLSAQAAWPKDLKAQYTAQCVPAAAKTIGEEAAKAHCACGADKIEKNFTTAQIKELMGPAGAKNPQLQQDALNAIAECKASPQPKK
ncbi:MULTISPECIES: hypothetical protein [Pseudomonas]|uniref:hypothetical protein n=1 Tax=Pseudomonas TaxID=286 RepID=UPI001296A0D9|nr:MULTISPECIES: hypothetical protein [Pseudomonas]MCU1757933.1 hypothetical protein [Pseudomonas helleri]MQT42336.1 hypothetical protein [Pseudomonas sp. FSL R10-0765]MQT54417.1 hypothetical protein [Pseudomonas sp. FSL R10-2398]MQU01006.1 hypothetical protein [Pseudomonas sp. FSL R10-2245]MQU11184.1 hypothetical protein [Pseudomonas sp. FSL R10-2189]